MTTKEQKVKRTYARDDVNQLLLKEAFERDLTLFAKLVQKEDGSWFGSPMVPKEWTFTVVKSSSGHKELYINVPPKK